MNRKIYHWKLRTTELQLGERTLIMGVLNATPDSFSDGGLYNDPDQAYARALEMEEQGADIIDLGAESTRPGSKRISADEEWQRLVPILKRLQGKLRIPLSLDTYKHETAERAMEYGVEIINDPSGLTFDLELAKVAANHNAGLILNHMRGTPETWAKLPPMPEVISMVGKELEACASRARRALVDKNRIVLDPGLGFGKRKEQNAEILAHLQVLSLIDYPLLIGASRKSFLAQGTEGETVMATAAAVSAAILRGAHIVRVHDVTEMRAVAAVADEIARYGDGAEEEEEEKPVRKQRTEEPHRYGDGEKAPPARPPLAIRKLPPVEETAAAPTEEGAAERPAYEKPEFPKQDFPRQEYPKQEYRPAAGRRDRMDDRPDRPSFRREDGPPRSYGPSGDRPPPRRDDGPPRSFRPSGDRPPPRRDDGPPRSFRPGGDRPQQRRDDGPPRSFRPGGDRPPPRRDDGPPRSFRPSSDRPPPRRDDGPPRSFRPGGDRPPFRPSGDRPPPRRDDGPPRSFRPGGDRPPRRDDERGGPPNRSFRPGGDRPQSGPPRGGRPDDRGGPPNRPFRKRP